MGLRLAFLFLRMVRQEAFWNKEGVASATFSGIDPFSPKLTTDILMPSNFRLISATDLVSVETAEWSLVTMLSEFLSF